MWECVGEALTGFCRNGKKNIIEGRVVLMKKNVLDFKDITASVLDGLHEIKGKRVSLQLISALHAQPGNGLKGNVGKPAHLENWITTGITVLAGESTFKVTFEWDEDIGIPGAFLIKNNHHSEFYLRSLTLENVPGQGDIHFVCNSWVYPAHRYKSDRVFFSNKAYLPCETPDPLVRYREEELENLRGDGRGELKEWDRVYDYAYYNDLGNPDKGKEYARPVLGKTGKYPYPRRGRTGRHPSKSDPDTESRLNLAMSLNIYVPRDERFGHLKMADFLTYALKSVVQVLKPELESLFDSTPNEFDSFEDVLKIYKGGIKVPEGIFKVITDNIHAEMLKEILRTDGAPLLKFPTPLVIKEDELAWRTDEEFAREMLAGLNPVVIQCLQEFPPTSKLDPEVYGEQNSSITREQLEINLNGLSVDEAIRRKKLFILDYHDELYPYLRRINSTSTKTYATRTILFLQDIGTLKPLAIELSLPHPDGDQYGAVNKVYMPAEEGGILETTVFPSRYSMEMSSVIYENWTFPDQALPTDLLKRGMAVEDPSSTYGLRLLIEDYPFAVDGLEIWFAIKTWVRDYCSFYYKTDDTVSSDTELQSWWKEIKEVGHGDKKDAPWWSPMQTREDLIETCTIIIWIASAFHAAINFGLFHYAGYNPNRPSLSRRFMLEKGTPKYDELVTSPDKAFLKTTTAQSQTLLGISLTEILSRHSSDEVYLGQRDTADWTSDAEPLRAFERFGRRLVKIEERIMRMNSDERLRNRVGPVKFPYTLLHPSSKSGLTAMGIPNSVSI